MALPWMIAAVAAAGIAGGVTTKLKANLDDTSPTDTEEENEQSDAITLNLLTELGQRIETARVLQRMTQEKCANMAKISRTALRNLEDGKDAKLSTLLAVSNALSIPVATIFESLQKELENKLLSKVEQ